MALLKPQGKIKWTASTSADVVGYAISQSTDGNPPTYDSASADVGNVTEVSLPIDGLPGVEGEVMFAVAAIDGAGNRSDFAVVESPVLVDVTAPEPPTAPEFSRDF